ncbi:WXG100 family type VII secretion target [Haloechinothrix sp. LS1_15]|uniref:WXG100 family type VII secretion target n=1 Tax=Haloechinothrix sp. LS1_15 TaxID=2652248 RepID=UPI002944914F|nr:WXG100 family type VII secretion target [Haloechinothrix sp. LS1_15]MDV6013090.1 WXG100 family type VII secretion target [Haloechinothrix sp. LS1_15]
MAQGFSGEIEEFTRAHQNVEATKANLDQILNKVRSTVEETRAGWQGQANKAFEELMARFDANALKMNQALQGIGEQLQAAGSTYEAQEMEVSEQVSSISSTLDG